VDRQLRSTEEKVAMSLSSRFALVPAADAEFSHTSPVCVYSFDLDGNVVEMNAAMASLLGYAREEATQMNLAQLMEPESWKSSREQILSQLG
jgi:PAS domain S-box-containing protein